MKTPEQLYGERLQALEAVQQRERRQEKRLAVAKLAMALFCVVLAFVLLRDLAHIAWILLPAAAMVVLIVLHEKLLRRLSERARRIDFYLRGLDRLRGQWAGRGESGERFLDDKHPYARDLDIFGKGSIFELLCTARTRAGEERLAAWLLAPAKRDVALARQQAIAELRPDVAAREELFLLGIAVRSGVHSERLARWGEKPGVFAEPWVRRTTGALAVLWLVSLVVWAMTQHAQMAELLTFVNLLWSRRIYRQADEAADHLEEAAADLKLLAGVLRVCEEGGFQAPMLVALQQKLRRQGMAPSQAIHRLAGLANALESRRNLVLRIPDVLIHWSAFLVFSAEKWQRQFGTEIREWLHVVGEFEALHSLSTYAYEHSDDPFAEIVEQGIVFAAEGLAHPLLPTNRAVRNDVSLGGDASLMVLSGPNMAGKSTFIRSIGVNAVLALMGAPVRARQLRVAEVQVAASICIQDSLSGGISRFYAEIHRVKQIDDLAAAATPVLFLLDELLSGTNSQDRRAGTEYVVKSLLERGAVGVVSTHDLALTRIPESLPGRAVNMHFEDRLEDGQMLFDYTLRPGVVQTSNALELMRSIGLGVSR